MAGAVVTTEFEPVQEGGQKFDPVQEFETQMESAPSPIEAAKGFARSVPWAEKIEEEVPIPLAATAGGVAGFAVGGPAGAVGGAFLGASFAESLRQIARHIGGNPKAPATSREAAEDILLAGGEEAAYEIGGQLIAAPFMRAGKRALSPFGGKVDPDAQVVRDLVERHMSPSVLASEIVPQSEAGAAALDIAQNIAHAGFLSAGKMRGFQAKRAAILQQEVVDDIMSSLAGPYRKIAPDTVTEILLETIANEKTAWEVVKNAAYESAQSFVAGRRISVPLGEAKAFVTPLKRLAKETGGIARTQAGDDLVKAIDAMPDNISLAGAVELRKRLLAVADNLKATQKKAPAIGVVNKLVERIDDAVEITLGRESKEALGAWRAANEFYKQGAKTFNNKLIKGLINAADYSKGGDPIKAVRAMTSTLGTVRAIKEVIKDAPPILHRLQTYHIEDIVRRSIASDTNEIMGKNLLTNLRPKTGAQRAITEELLEPGQIALLEKFGKALVTAQKKRGTGTGHVVIQLMQAGALGGFTTAMFTASPTVGLVGNTAILMAPPVLARLLTSKKAMNYLIGNLVMPKHLANVPAAVGRLTRMANGMQQEEDRKE